MSSRSHDAYVPFAAIISLWVVSVSAYLAYVVPTSRWPYLLALVLVLTAWFARHLTSAQSTADASENARKKLSQAIVLAGLMLGATLTAALARHEGWAFGLWPDLDARLRGVLMGIVVVAMSSGIPKQPASARGLALRRVMGWALVLSGLGFALSWLVLPLSYARLVAPSLLAAGLLFAVIRIQILR